MPGASRARSMGCSGTRRRRGRGAAGRRPVGRGDSASGGGAGAAGDREPTAAAAGPACLATVSTSLPVRRVEKGRGELGGLQVGRGGVALSPHGPRLCAARQG